MRQNTICGKKFIFILSTLILGFLGPGALPAMAGGLIVYKIGTADVGLASAGYNDGRRTPRRYSQTRPA